jgi:hypothetical protein
MAILPFPVQNFKYLTPVCSEFVAFCLYEIVLKVTHRDLCLSSSDHHEHNTMLANVSFKLPLRYVTAY